MGSRLRTLRHRSSVFWTVTAVLAIVTGLIVGGMVDRAESLREGYGTRAPVTVATRSLPAGHRIEADDLREIERPVAFTPNHQVEVAPVGLVVIADIMEGEPIASDRVALTARSGVSARLPEGSAAIAIPVDEDALPLDVGDRVDVWVSSDPFGSGVTASTRSVSAALVVETGPRRVTVAVDRDRIGEVVAGLRSGGADLALVQR